MDHPNHVLVTDITHIKLSDEFMYLAAILYMYSRKVSTWSLSNMLVVSFCIEALNEACARYGTPEIINSDQGSQLPSSDFTGKLDEDFIRISMDGKGRAKDNIFAERLWRSLKYKDISIKRYTTVLDCANGIYQYFKFYNAERFHQSPENRAHDEIYFGFEDGRNL